MKSVNEIGFIDKGTGKHQSNVVYSASGGGSGSYSDSIAGSKDQYHDYRYELCNKTSYCIDANYAKGTSFEEYIKKHRRQLVIERY